MKKVLILTYFFPPGNFAGSYRPASWVKHFHEFGLYPVVVTRHWDKSMTGFSDISGNRDIRVEKNNSSEIHYLPYRGNWRDQLLLKGKDHFVSLRRLLSFAELLFRNFCNRAIPFRNLFQYATKILKEQKDIDVVVITAKPFILFRFGYLLKKKFPHIRWIADYRDPWNTHVIYGRNHNGLLRLLERRSEKKWVASASAVITCSDLWALQIGQFTGKPVQTVMNGYDEPLLAAMQNEAAEIINDRLILLHLGSLYPVNEIEAMITGVINTIKSGNKRILVRFVGLSDDRDAEQRVRKLTAGFEAHFDITPKLAQEQLYRELLSAHLFLLFGAPLLKGWYPVKIFEYLAAGKPVLMCPGDHDAAENLIRDVHAGYICYSASELENTLTRCYNEWLSDGRIAHEPDQEKISTYSRRKQAGILAEIIFRLDEAERKDRD